MISKEVLNEVLNIKTDYLGYIDRSKNIEFRESQGFLKKINIYELAHKCKEWVIKYYGWTLQSYTNERGSGICRIKVGDGQEINKLIASSEPVAIFKACEYIMENKCGS